MAIAERTMATTIRMNEVLGLSITARVEIGTVRHASLIIPAKNLIAPAKD